MITDEKQQINADGMRETKKERKMEGNSGQYIYKNLTYKIIGCAYEIHKELGCLHKEVIYQKALAIEFERNGIPFVKEHSIQIKYQNKPVGVYRPDFIVNDKVMIEIKVLPKLTKACLDQVFYYAKATEYKLVLLINFGTPKVTIKRLIYT